MMNLEDTVFRIGKQYRFAEDRLPYTCRVISMRYVILTRPFDLDEDADMLFNEGDATTLVEDEELVYTIIDRKTGMRGPHNIIFNNYDFKEDSGCHELLDDLTSEEVELSRRKSVECRLLNDGQEDN